MADEGDILFRFVEKYPGIDTVEEHRKVVSENGAVWLGKVGRGLSERTISSINSHCQTGTAYMYFARLVNAEYKMHKSKLLEIRKDLPSKETRLVPAYYAEHRITPFVEVWFKLEDLVELDSKVIEKLKIKSTGSKLFDTMKGSPKSLFLISREP